MFRLFRILIGLTVYFVRREAARESIPEADPALYQKRSRSISQYIEMAANALINDGRKADEVKMILLGNGLHKDHMDVVMEKAERRYKNWLGEIGTQSASSSNQEQQLSNKQSAGAETVVKITTMADEDHALHYSALIGFKRYYDLSGRKIIYAVARDTLASTLVIVDGDIAIKQASFGRYGGTEDHLFLRIITVSNQQQAVYPYLKATNHVGFKSRQITEWANSDPIIEAEIEGEWNNSLTLCFFATDYAVNKSIYKSNSNINIKLSAFAFDLEQSERNENRLDQKAKGLWPVTGYKHPSYFSFEGVILDIKPAPVDKLSDGCIISLILVNSGYLPGSDLIIDTYVSAGNIKAATIQKSMLVTGTLWVQGELAD
jgi:hypothetical protein